MPIIESTEEQQNRLKLEYKKRLAGLAISDSRLVDEPIDDITKWPSVCLGSIFSYILKVRDFDREYVGEYKDQKAYSYFDSGFVDTILVHEPKEQNCKKFVYVYCKVTAYQSVNEKKELWVVIDKKSVEVCLAWCSCMAGASACCNHIIAALYKIDYAQTRGYCNPACTSVTCSSLQNVKLKESVCHRSVFVKSYVQILKRKEMLTATGTDSIRDFG